VISSNDFILEQGRDGSLELTGALNLSTVPRIYQESLSYFIDSGSIPGTIDLAGVNSADSAGLALMIEWLRLAKKQNSRISFRNIPVQITPLARLFGVDHLLK
jgi:Predicted NTP binding protein (contains STAS domain)